jgi:hypothetical protein
MEACVLVAFSEQQNLELRLQVLFYSPSEAFISLGYSGGIFRLDFPVNCFTSAIYTQAISHRAEPPPSEIRPDSLS